MSNFFDLQVIASPYHFTFTIICSAECTMHHPSADLLQCDVVISTAALFARSAGRQSQDAVAARRPGWQCSERRRVAHDARP